MYMVLKLAVFSFLPFLVDDQEDYHLFSFRSKRGPQSGRNPFPPRTVAFVLSSFVFSSDVEVDYRKGQVWNSPLTFIPASLLFHV